MVCKIITIGGVILPRAHTERTIPPASRHPLQFIVQNNVFKTLGMLFLTQLSFNTHSNNRDEGGTAMNPPPCY